VPVSIESMAVLTVVAGETRILIPFDTVCRAVRLHDKDLARSRSGGTIIWENQAISFRFLGDILGHSHRPGNSAGTWTALVIQAGDARAAIGVDRLEGIQTVVVRPLPELCGSVPLIAGATLDGEGNP